MITQEHGSLGMLIRCFVSSSGAGAIFSAMILMSLGTMEFNSCEAGGRGQVLWTSARLTSLLEALCILNSCVTMVPGGAIESHDLTQTGGNMSFHNCTAHKGGWASMCVIIQELAFSRRDS